MMQAKVGPTMEPGRGCSVTPAVHRSMSSGEAYTAAYSWALGVVLINFSPFDFKFNFRLVVGLYLINFKRGCELTYSSFKGTLEKLNNFKVLKIETIKIEQ